MLRATAAVFNADGCHCRAVGFAVELVETRVSAEIFARVKVASFDEPTIWRQWTRLAGSNISGNNRVIAGAGSAIIPPMGLEHGLLES